MFDNSHKMMFLCILKIKITMFYHRSSWFVGLLLAVFVWQCASDSAPAATAAASAATFKASFHVRYIAGQGELRGQADFTPLQSGQSVPEIEGGVAFWGSATNKKTLPGDVIRFESTTQGTWLAGKNFRFQLPGSTTPVEIPILMDGIQDMRVAKASKTTGIEVNMGTTLSDDESLVFIFTDAKGETRTIVRPGPLAADPLLLPADALYHFTPGAYTVYAVKTQKSEGTAQGLNYLLQVEYYGDEIEFDLEN